MPVRILVVDDNRDTLRAYVKAILREIKTKEWDAGSQSRLTEALPEVDEADTVAIALQKLRTKPFEMLVVDLKIPGLKGNEMGGEEIIDESMELDPLRPIIAITGYGTVDLARKTLTQGVFDFIEKSTTAVDDLLKAVQKAIDYRNERIIRSGNPFPRMTGVEPTNFGGRITELDFFNQKLNRAIQTGYCEHFLVLGNWGIGKSTLLNKYKKICQSRRLLASIVPLERFQQGTSLNEAAISIVAGIIRDLPYSIDKFSKLLEFFESFEINVVGTGIKFKRDTSKKDITPQTFLYDTLIHLWQDLKEKTNLFVILLDDIDNFMAVAEIFMTLKSTLSLETIRKTGILVGITSTPATWQELTGKEVLHPLSRYFLSKIELSPLNKNEVRQSILGSLSGTGVSFSENIMNRVFEYTKGHPFKVQVLCHHLFNHQISGRVEIDFWDKGLIATLEDIGDSLVKG